MGVLCDGYAQWWQRSWVGIRRSGGRHDVYSVFRALADRAGRNARHSGGIPRRPSVVFLVHRQGGR